MSLLSMTRRALMAAALAAVAPAAAAAQARTDMGTLVYVGTYTGAKSEGIYAFRFDEKTGTLTPAGLAAATANPSFLAVHPNGRWLFAVNEVETEGGARSGAVASFAIDHATGRLSLLSREASEGAGPCHLSIDRTGRYVLVANYGGGTVAVLPIGTDGRLGKASSVQQHAGSSVDPSRQRAPHAHGIEVDPANRFALAADLGIDKLLVYRLDAETGRLAPHTPPSAALPPGSGPRHFAFDPGGRRVYVINELTNTIATFDWDAAAGRLSAGSTPWPLVSTLPESFTGANTTAEIQVHPSGRFVYGSNRGHDSIAVFRVDEEGRRLVPVGHNPTGGKTPRHFTLTADGQWLLTANQGSDTLTVYRVNQDRGALGPPGGPPASVGSPVCIVFVSPAR